MGKASSSKKVQRAKRAAGSPGAKKSYTWPLAIGAVVIVGVLLVVLSATGRDSASAAPPRLGDHWHAAYGIYDCNEFLPPLSDTVPDESGIHTHADGLVHMHPFSTRYTGDGANLGAWGETVGLDLTDDSVRAAGIDRSNGDACEGENAGEGEVQLWIWDSPQDTEGERVESDLADYAPQDGTMLVIAFAPEGTEIPPPPPEAVASLAAPVDVVGPENTIPPSSVPAEEPTDESTTSVPATEPDDASTTTAPAETTTTAAP